MVVQANQSRPGPESIRLEMGPEKLIRRSKDIQGIPARGAEGNAVDLETTQIAREVRSHRDSYGRAGTEHTRDMAIEYMLRPEAIKSLITEAQEVDTASCKAFGEQSVELRDFVAYEAYLYVRSR